ncbi:hypothetical protein ACFV1U_14380 [Streptomyces microflavus]|uniref:hypothetical protein n=1 Tax=Streptomyces microflavus TaxID=1919 RepID=UPI0036C04EEA
MDYRKVRAEVRRYQADMHVRQRRVTLLHRALRDAEAERDRSVAGFVAFGEQHEGARDAVSRRAIGRQLGVTHPAVNAMVERARTRSRGPAALAPLVPVLGADEAREYVQSGALGDIARVLVAMYPGDILLESGLDPSAFANGTDIDVPNMLIQSADGAAIGVEDCLAGYGGTGPSNTVRLLEELGFPVDLAREVFDYRFVELAPDRVLRSGDAVHQVGGGLELSSDGQYFIARVRSQRTYLPGGDLIAAHTVAAWCSEVMDEPERYPWAAGERRARVYLDRNAAASLNNDDPHRIASNRYSVVIEQGRLQLWVSAYFPYNFADLLSTEQLHALDAAGMRPEGIEPRTWLDRFLPRRRERPPFILISEDGQDLAHSPEGATQE